MFGRQKKSAIDINQIASSALNAFLEGGEPSKNGGHPESTNGDRHRLGAAGAVALGAAAAAAGRAVYTRAKRVDLAEVAERVEDRLKG